MEKARAAKMGIPTVPGKVRKIRVYRCPFDDGGILRYSEEGGITFCDKNPNHRWPGMTESEAAPPPAAPPGTPAAPPRKAAPRPPAERVSAKWHLKGRAIEAGVLVIVAAFAAMFGLNLLAAALVLYIPYMTMPDHYRLIAAARKRLEEWEGERGALPPEEANAKLQDTIKRSTGILWARAVLKLTIILLAMFEFVGRTFFLPLAWISLAIGIVAYFSLPSTYRASRPWQLIEGWMRFALGIFNSALLWAILTGQTNLIVVAIAAFGWVMLIPGIGVFIVLSSILGAMLLGGAFLSPATGLFFLGLAFFAIPPAKEEEVG